MYIEITPNPNQHTYKQNISSTRNLYNTLFNKSNS